MEKDEFITVIALLEQALACDKYSSRANWLMAKVYENHQQYEQACQRYQAIYQQDDEFFPDVIEKMFLCYQALDKEEAFYKFIGKVYQETGSTSALLKYVEHIEKNEGHRQANAYILVALKRRPTIRGFKHFVKMQMNDKTTTNTAENLDVIRKLISEYLKVRQRYSCKTCGFNTNTHYWSCPSCHEWEQIKPIRGLHGE